MSQFPTTIWTIIRNAGAGRATAEADFVARYRPAIVRFARRRGLDESGAEDIAQEVFLRVFDDGLLERAESARGRFRSLLLAVTRHVLGHHFEQRSARKRGGGRAPLSLDASTESFEALVGQEVQDPEFDREWLAALLESALRRLERENRDSYLCVHAFLVDERSHREIAASLGKTEAAVASAISRGRAKLGVLLQDEVRAYSSSEGEFEDELRLLATLVGPTRPPKPASG